MNNDIIIRAAEIAPNSFNKETRSFNAVLATSAPVRRRGGHEILDLASMQLPASVPLLLDHRATVNSTVGRAANIRRDGDSIIADCRLSGDPALASLAERIADGTVTGISIGYSVQKWAEARGAAGERTHVAIGAVLRHAALVAEPADANAGIRSAGDGDGFDGHDDDGDNNGDNGNNDPAARNAHIRSLCRALGLRRELEDRAIDGQWHDQQIMEQVRSRSDVDIRVNSHDSFDDPTFYREALVDSMVARISGGTPQGAARELAGLSWPELHRRHLRQAGQSVRGLSDVEVITRALTTSDMPIIAGSVIRIAIRRQYEASISPISSVFGARELPDFRPQIQALVDWTTLAVDKVAELGEFKASISAGDKIPQWSGRACAGRYATLVSK